MPSTKKKSQMITYRDIWNTIDAIAQNVDYKYLESGLVVNKSGSTVSSISYNYNIIPFVPLNPVDVSLELEAYAPELFHNMILFSHHNEL